MYGSLLWLTILEGYESNLTDVGDWGLGVSMAAGSMHGSRSRKRTAQTFQTQSRANWDWGKAIISGLAHEVLPLTRRHQLLK